MSYNNPNAANHSSTNSSEAIPELKLYQAFIFSVPICFAFILLFLFYLFYLRRGSVDWSSLRMRDTMPNIHTLEISRAELGLKKEVREMLPIIIYRESFSVKEAQCPVCLGDYQANDKLQQIPVCGHAFHMDCIDRWLSAHNTCPLCRLSLLGKLSPNQSLDDNPYVPNSVSENPNGASSLPGSHPSEETRNRPFSESRNGSMGTLEGGGTNGNEEQESQKHMNQGCSEVRDTRKEREKDERSA